MVFKEFPEPTFLICAGNERENEPKGFQWRL